MRGLTLGMGMGVPFSGIGPAWSPSQLGASLLGQFDAENAASLSITGSDVNSWTDSVSGAVLAQTLTARPIYNATGLNGRPCLVFDGVSQCLALASTPFPTGANPCEIWALVSQDALIGDTTQKIAMAWGNVANTSRRAGRAVATGVSRARVTVGTGAASPSMDNTGVVFEGVHVIRAIISATDCRIDVDVTAGLPATAAIPSTATNMTRIGALSAAAAANFWVGKINWIGVTGLLTDGQAANLNGFLLDRAF